MKIKNQLDELCSEKGVQRSLSKVIFRLKQPTYRRRESNGNGGCKKISHVTYCVAPNAGDTVLSQCVRHTIEGRLKTSGWNIVPVSKQVTEKTVNDINKTGLLVIGGGGLFLPDTNKNSISGWQWAISKELLDKIEVPVCVFSVGYNYFRGQESNELFKESLCKLAKKSSFFGLRNIGSVETIGELLPSEYKPKLSFQPCTTTLIRKIYDSVLPEKHETGSVAINMAFDRENLRFGNNRELILQQVAKAIKLIDRKGYRIYYVCHCWNDDKFIPYLKRENIDYELVDLSRKYPIDVYNFYNDIDVVIGMRGHAQMIPFGLNCEIISLGTHNKMKWFLQDIHSEDWYINLSEDCETIADRIIACFIRIHEDERDRTKARLYSEQSKLWDITKRNLDYIEELL